MLLGIYGSLSVNLVTTTGVMPVPPFLPIGQAPHTYFSQAMNLILCLPIYYPHLSYY